LSRGSQVYDREEVLTLFKSHHAPVDPKLHAYKRFDLDRRDRKRLQRGLRQATCYISCGRLAAGCPGLSPVEIGKLSDGVHELSGGDVGGQPGEVVGFGRGPR